MINFAVILNMILLFAIPIAAVSFLLISLILFCMDRIKSKRNPGSVSSVDLAVSRTRLILAAAISGVLAVVIIVFIALIGMYLSNM